VAFFLRIAIDGSYLDDGRNGRGIWRGIWHSMGRSGFCVRVADTWAMGVAIIAAMCDNGMGGSHDLHVVGCAAQRLSCVGAAGDFAGIDHALVDHFLIRSGLSVWFLWSIVCEFVRGSVTMLDAMGEAAIMASGDRRGILDPLGGTFWFV
jgi:hypothetical protein